MTDDRKPDVLAGHMYAQWHPRGRLDEVPVDAVIPDVVICRRLADYRPAVVPTGAALTPCSACGATVVYNPQGRFLERPRVCMQCARIEPLPITETP